MGISYLNSINYFLDKQCHVSDLEYLKNNIEKAEKYASLGAKYHFKTDKTSSELAYWVLFNFLNEKKIARDQIDYVFFTSDNLDGSNDINTLTANSLLNELEIVNAIPIFQSFSNCANIGVTFNSAASLIESGRANNILIVSVDNLGGEDYSYIMDSEMSVYSDASICLWLSSRPDKKSLQIKDIFIKNNHTQWLIDRKADYQKSSINKLKLYKSISKNIKDKINKADYLITNNYFNFINEMFIGMFGKQFINMHYSNISEIGHSPAGDVFINLFDIREKITFKPEQTIVLVSESPSLCIGIVLESV